MKRSGLVRRVKVSADGVGVVSHTGVGLLRELAEYSGLVDGVTAALIDTYKGAPLHAPGRVFCDLATAVADGADAISGIAVLSDREASTTRERRDFATAPFGASFRRTLGAAVCSGQQCQLAHGGPRF